MLVALMGSSLAFVSVVEALTSVSTVFTSVSTSVSVSSVELVESTAFQGELGDFDDEYETEDDGERTLVLGDGDGDGAGSVGVRDVCEEGFRRRWKLGDLESNDFAGVGDGSELADGVNETFGRRCDERIGRRRRFFCTDLRSFSRARRSLESSSASPSSPKSSLVSSSAPSSSLSSSPSESKVNMGSVLECLWAPFECGGLLVSSSSSSGPVCAIKTAGSVPDNRLLRTVGVEVDILVTV